MIELENPQIEPVEEAGTYAKYEAGPLQAGYGVTLGNALRRVLLSSLEGAAVTSIQIRDVYQEFSTIPGVKEDVTQIVLNVKKLRLKSFATHPVQLRLINHADAHPQTGKPWSSKYLKDCYSIASEKFGWQNPKPAPRSMRDNTGRLIGYGMATANYGAGRRPSSAVVRFLPNGRIFVGVGTQDLGTGTYTILAQTAADALFMDPALVDVKLGDTTLPPSGGSGGSTTAASVCPGVYDAAMQAKLLRVIQNREIQRVGSPEVRRVDVRLIAATNRDLRGEVASGRFREDLFYRLSTIQIRVPSLAERQEDVPALITFFIKKCNAAYAKHIQGLTRRAQMVLLQHSWPGNVRELENVISSASLVAQNDFIDVQDLPENLQNPERPSEPAKSWRPLPLQDVRREHIERVLELCSGNRVRAAQMLGIGRTSLYRYLKREGRVRPANGIPAV